MSAIHEPTSSSSQAAQTIISVGTISSAPMPTLPIDMIFTCLSFLSAKDVVTCSSVCKQWHQVAQDNRLWASLLERDFPHFCKTEVKHIENAKQVYQDQCRFRRNRAKGIYAVTAMPIENKLIRALISTKDGQLILACSDSMIEIRYPNTGKLVKTLQGHINQVRSLVLTEGNQLISGDSGGIIKIWDLNTGTCLMTLQGHHTEEVNSLILSKDKQQFISGSFDKTIKIWDLNTGTCLMTLQGHSQGIQFLLLTEKGQLISASDDSTIKIWDLNTGTCLKTLQGHIGRVRSLVLTEEGQLISGALDKTIKIWDLNTGECQSTLQEGLGEVRFLILNEDGQLISGDSVGIIKIWDLKTGQCLSTFRERSSGVTFLLLTKKGKLLSGYYDRMYLSTITIFDFNASNEAIFQELAEKFKEETTPKTEYITLLERFRKMPIKEREKIYMEFHALFSDFSFEAFYVVYNLPGENLGQKRAQAITNYLKKLSNVPVVANTAPPVEKSSEELNEVFQYFTDILQITKNQKKVFFPKSEFSAAFIEHAGLVNTADLQAIGINPKLMGNLAQLQGQLKQLSQKSEQKEKTNQHLALETITPIKDSIESLLVNLLPLKVIVPLDDLILMQSSLIKRKTLLEQVMESPQTCNQFVDSGDLFEFARSLLADVIEFNVTDFEQYIKRSQIELLEAYLSQPDLNATWENLQANGITQASQLAKQPSEFYRLYV